MIFHQNTPNGQQNIMDQGHLNCDLCKVTFHRSSWLDHFASDVHQIMTKSVTKGGHFPETWPPSRTVHLCHISGIPVKELLQYVMWWGEVEDFIYLSTKNKDTSAHNCYALMKSKRAVRDLVDPIVPHTLPSGRSLRVKRVTTAGDGGKDVGGEQSSSTPAKVSPAGPSSIIKPLPSVRHKDLNDAMTMWKCPYCEVSSASCFQWIEHLLTPAHIKMQCVKSQGPSSSILTAWDCTKAVILKCLPPGQKSAATHYAQNYWGDIRDVYGSNDIVYVLFSSRETANRILSFKDYILLDECKLEVEAIPEFSGHTKAEKQILRAEKLAQSMIGNFDPSRLVADANLTKRELVVDERENILKCLEDKDVEEQLQILSSRVQWSKEFYSRCNHFIEKVLLPCFGRLDDSFHKSKLSPVGLFTSEAAISDLDGNRTVHMVLDISGTSYLHCFSSHVVIIHKIRQLLESNACLGIISGSLKAAPVRCPIVNIAMTSESFMEVPEISFSTDFFSSVSNGGVLSFKIRIENHSLAKQESRIIQHYCTFDPRIRSLLSIVSYHRQVWSLLTAQEELFPNHFVSMFLIHFLQQRKTIPTIHQLLQEQKELRNPKDDTPSLQGFQIEFSSPKIVKTSPVSHIDDPLVLSLSLLSILKDFFTSMANVGPHGDVICLRNGCNLPKTCFEETHPEAPSVEIAPGVCVCTEIRSLYMKNKGKVDLPSWCHIVLQDPLVLNVNLTRNLGWKKFYQFRSICRIAKSFLEVGFKSEKPCWTSLFKKYVHQATNHKP